MSSLFSTTTPPALNVWEFPSGEGQLTVDVFREGDSLVVRSFLAGINQHQIEIGLDGDLLTIRGQREEITSHQKEDWFYKECYWGGFSRSIVLPLDVYAEKAEAHLHHGVLEIRIPIREAQRSIQIQTRARSS